MTDLFMSEKDWFYKQPGMKLWYGGCRTLENILDNPINGVRETPVARLRGVGCTDKRNGTRQKVAR